jgi:hypothetical protein
VCRSAQGRACVSVCQGLVNAGREAYRASQTRNQEAVSDATNVLSDACANCHRVYRDVPSAAMRCTPAN